MDLLAFKGWNWRCLGEEVMGIKEPSAFISDEGKTRVTFWLRGRPGPCGGVGSDP